MADKPFSPKAAAVKRQEIVVRDYMAGHAMAALVQAHGANASTFADEIAKDAYEIADAMLKQKRETT